MPFWRRKLNLQGKHVLITGGSAGIGLSLAKRFVKLGCHVTLVARTASKLEQAQKELQDLAAQVQSGSRIGFQVADVTVFTEVQRAAQEAQRAAGPLDLVICNAGASEPGYFHEQDVQVFERMMRLNYLGLVHTVKAVYSDMVARNSGHICLVSSVMGTMGFVGYTAYAPTKYAVRGLADCLRNEVQGTNVTVSLAFPPDTDTPGYETENLSKPEETKVISAGSSVFTPDQVAEGIVRGIQSGCYVLPNPDLGLQIHAGLVQGMVPRRFPGVLLDMLLGLVGPVIHAIHAGIMDRTSKKHAQRRFAGLWTGQEAAAGAGRSRG